jgi:hypothetical protein
MRDVSLTMVWVVMPAEASALGSARVSLAYAEVPSLLVVRCRMLRSRGHAGLIGRTDVVLAAARHLLASS